MHPGLIYLVLTTAVSVIQLFVERALDLDRPATEGRLARLLPWYRAPLVVQPVEGRTGCRGPDALPARDAKVSRADRTKRSATLAHNEVVVEVGGLYKAYTTSRCLRVST